MKKERNICVRLSRKNIKNHLNKINEKGVPSSKDFWNSVKPFLTKKCFIDSAGITLKLDNKIITDKTQLVESFNNHYVSNDEQSSGLKPTALGQKGQSDKAAIYRIIESYKSHPSI